MKLKPERPLFPHLLHLDQLSPADGTPGALTAWLIKKDKHVIALITKSFGLVGWSLLQVNLCGMINGIYD